MDEEFPEIKTGNGIDRDLAATTNDRLKKTVLELRSLKDAIGKLEKTIVGLDEKNEKLQTRIFWLTIVALALAALQVLEVVKLFVDWMK